MTGIHSALRLPRSVFANPTCTNGSVVKARRPRAHRTAAPNVTAGLSGATSLSNSRTCGTAASGPSRAA